MRLLIVGNLKGYMSQAGKIALDRGANVSHVLQHEDALNALRRGEGADLIFLDVNENVETFINSLKQERITVPIITCGINVTSALASKSIELGATDYIPLPPDPNLIAAVLEAVTEKDKSLAYRDPNMVQVLNLAKRIAPSNASVLITGESGTGKEVIANYIHQHSKRAQKKFISVNCAAIPENLLESELFGHEKGAFTGAVARRIGKFEEANGGTLLLDEISEMHPRLQAKLLRAIQEREIDRVGGNTPIKVDIRLLATSNRNLQEAVKEGDFREDLYFRLNVVNINLPALRDRPQDILVIAEHFLDKYARANHISLEGFTPDAIKTLEQYHWPGNVRELENAIHRSVLLAHGPTVDSAAIMLPQGKASHAPEAIKEPFVNPSTPEENAASLVGRTVSEVEQELILGTLNHCLGNRTQAANILGISIRTLRNKLKIYTEEGIHIPATQEHAARAANYKQQGIK